jgi:hypothetical protein
MLVVRNRKKDQNADIVVVTIIGNFVILLHVGFDYASLITVIYVYFRYSLRKNTNILAYIELLYYLDYRAEYPYTIVSW